MEKPPHKEILEYIPLCTLPSGAAKGVTKPAGGIVSIIMCGWEGVGKSALGESCEHVVRGLPFYRFRRQCSSTLESVPIPLTDHVVLVDTPGSILKKEDGWGSWLGKVCNWTTLPAVEIHGVIFVHPANKLMSIGGLSNICVDFKRIIGCDPIIVITKVDEGFDLTEEEMEKFGSTPQSRASWVQRKVGCGIIFFTTCYTKWSMEDQQRNEDLASMLMTTLATVDEVLYRRKVARIIFRN